MKQFFTPVFFKKTIGIFTDILVALLLLIACLLPATQARSQQVDGIFTPFANSNDFANSWINDIKVETSGSITVGGYYQGRPDASNDRTRTPMLVSINGSNGVVRSNFGSPAGGGALITYINTTGNSYGNNAIKKLQSSTSGTFILAGEFNSNSLGYIAKTNESGSRPTAFNSANIILPDGPGIKSYVEEMIFLGTSTFVVARYSGTGVVVENYNATSGQLVASFGTGGKVVLPSPPNGVTGTANGIKMIRMPDGGFYVAHTTGTYVVVSKLLSNGQFDNSFFNKGYTMFPSGFIITSLSVKANGDVVTGGKGFNEPANMPSVGFVTFKTNGDLQLVSNATQFPLGTSMETSIPVGAADDPKFIAAGSKIVNGKPHVFIQKYNPDDTADHLIVTPWLGKNGISAIPTAITKYYSSHYLVAANMIGPHEDTVAVILKYNLDGTIDPSFGQNGACYLYAIQAGQGWADVVQFPDGKYLAGGTATYISDDPNKRAIVLNKFLEDGRPDSSFGEYGRLYAQLSSSSRTAEKLHAYPNGSFLVSGTIQNGLYNNTSITCVYKFLADGSPDASFGISGVRWLGNMDNEDFLATDTAIYVAGSNGSTARSQVIKMTPDGNVSRGYSMGSRYYDAMGINPISGSVFIGTGYTAAANVVYKSMENGTIDADFGVNGYALLTAIPDGTSSSPAWIRQIKTNPAGVIMVVRVWQATSGPNKPQAIYFNWITPDGKVDSSTGGLGTKKLIIPNTSSIVAEKYQWIENGNKLLIFGQAVVNGITKGMIAKVTTSGNLDASFGTGGVIWSNSTFGGIYNFNRSGDIISVINNGLLGGSSLAKMDVPFTVYHTMKAAAWTGGVNNDWFNPANWSENEVPDANTVVVIATGNCNIPANMHAVAYSVEVKSGAYFTIGGNATLTVTSAP